MDCESHSDNCTKANGLNNYFSFVFTKDDHSPNPDMNGVPVLHILPIKIEVDGVCNLLSNLVWIFLVPC